MNEEILWDCAHVSSREEFVEKFPIVSMLFKRETHVELGFQPSAFADPPVGFQIEPAWDSIRFTMALRSMGLLSEVIGEEWIACDEERWKQTFRVENIPRDQPEKGKKGNPYTRGKPGNGGEEGQETGEFSPEPPQAWQEE